MPVFVPEPPAGAQLAAVADDKPAHERHAKRLFKLVTGVLNKAFSDGRLTECEEDVRALLTGAPDRLQFLDACQALASAVKVGLVPPQGLKVLKMLLDGDDTPCGSLRQAVGLEDESPRDCAAQILQSVSSVLNGDLPSNRIVCERSIRHWAPQAELKFSVACDALACAIAEGLVPDDSLQALTSQCQDSTLDIGQQLALVLPAIPLECDESTAESVSEGEATSEATPSAHCDADDSDSKREVGA